MKKKALLYTRVSTSEQADRGYSLRDQAARLQQYCKFKGVEVAQHFEEDYSAKTFSRPKFQTLLEYAKANRRDIDYLLVVKWDRFSRDATGALGMIRQFQELGIEVNAVEQWIDFSIPENKFMLSFYVTSP